MTTRANARAVTRRRPLLRSLRFWIPVGVVLLLLVLALAGVLIGKPIYDRAMSAKVSLEQAMPLAATAKSQIIAGDTEAAKATAAQLATLTADARAQTDDDTWKGVEWAPFIGPNLHAVRTAAAVADDLVTGAVIPATDLSLAALTPVDGAIDLAAVTEMQSVFPTVVGAVDKAAEGLDSIDQGALIPQVSGALTKLTDLVDEIQPVLGATEDILGVLPAALGADSPRNYLTIFQNNAESRGTGGSPAAIVMITADQGRLTITQQAASGDFENERPEPVIALDPELEALYGDKVGRWISDTTMTPDFGESVDIIRAYWAETFGTPVDAVVSFDPVALGYLLSATGPTMIPPGVVEIQGREIELFGDPITLTSDNAVSLLLNKAYSMYPDPYMQDAFFAAATKSIFDAVTSGSANPAALLSSLMQAVDENRLLYSPANEAEAALVGESKLSGRLPTSNDERTLVGVYVNDYTSSKLDYYMQLDVAAHSNQCTAPDSPTFTTTATLTNTITPAQAPNLPYHISPAIYFDRGTVATYLVFYGPVGSELKTVTIDGKRAKVSGVHHLGRGAVKVAVENTPSQTHTVVAEFTGAAGTYGPFDVQHTPMVLTVGEKLTAPGCD